ncbi:hypothetical protein J5N97_013513 [Dioscorea zingiberensis]|uniref:Uncharacterized protein n=1 Tax=Dioscorea zingiberensis TaxID=325984 RepID=A0A9D5CS01_9LILI|nr:hypothetical protein J5N97_013513 [Dioscorea zingiberensis]
MLVVAPAASFHPQHHHHHHHHHESLLPSGEHPIIPLLTAAPCLVDDPHHDTRAKHAGIQLWQPQPQPQQPPPSQNPNPGLPYLKKPVPMLDAPGILSSVSGASTCQDCGNQAKKDCNHRRCRTCCKSRGFECSTHVKSTWVPAARRRERQLSVSAAAVGPGSSASTSASKKPRLISSQTTTTSHTSTSNTTPPRSFDTSSSHQDASFRDSLPGHVQAPAVFKCVRVTSIDDGEDEYAYQAMVRIGGHVFKGFLYDQGLDDQVRQDDTTNNTTTSTSNNNSGNIPNISDLHLGGGARNGASSSSPMLGGGPSDLFAGGGSSGGGGLLGGTSYGNPIN